MAVIGTLLGGRYRLDARIGRGGMSTVYRAFDTVLERSVAIKLMHAEIASDSDHLERFRREARAVAQLSHPHIVTVIDAGEEISSDGHGGPVGTPYIVLEYVPGETLKDMIRREGPLEIPQAIAYAIEIARALGAAHERMIVHRDVKPQNVLIGEEGGAKITDFGIARSLTEEGLTIAGRVLGTTDYVSPEQALGEAVTGQSDLYSLGIVLYEMLTGEVPFRGETPVAVAMRHVREQVPDVQDRRPAVSAASLALLVAIVAIVLYLAAGQTHRGTGVPPGVRSGAGLVPVPLSQTAAHGYNPFGTGPENQNRIQNVIDSDPNTSWSTQQYYEGTLTKAGGVGTGVYLDAAPGVTATAIEIQTPTPGFAVQVYAANSIRLALPYGNATPLPARGWQGPLGSSPAVVNRQRIRLAVSRPYRYYLVWLTTLPPGMQSASVNELTLFR